MQCETSYEFLILRNEQPVRSVTVHVVTISRDWEANVFLQRLNLSFQWMNEVAIRVAMTYIGCWGHGIQDPITPVYLYLHLRDVAVRWHGWPLCFCATSCYLEVCSTPRPSLEVSNSSTGSRICHFLDCFYGKRCKRWSSWFRGESLGVIGYVEL